MGRCGGSPAHPHGHCGGRPPDPPGGSHQEHQPTLSTFMNPFWIKLTITYWLFLVILFIPCTARLVPAFFSAPEYLSFLSASILNFACCLPLSFLPLSTCLSAFSTLSRLYVAVTIVCVPVSICDYRLFACLLSNCFLFVCLCLWWSCVCLFVFVTIDCLPILIVCLLSASLSGCLSLWLSSMCMSISWNIVCVPILLSDYRLYAYLPL